MCSCHDDYPSFSGRALVKKKCGLLSEFVNAIFIELSALLLGGQLEDEFVKGVLKVYMFCLKVDLHKYNLPMPVSSLHGPG